MGKDIKQILRIKRIKKFIAGQCLYRCMLLLRIIIFLLPVSLVDIFGTLLGGFSFFIFARDRRRSFIQIRNVLKLNSFDSVLMVFKFFIHLGKQYVETVKFPYLSEKAFRSRYQIHGTDILNNILKEGKGGIIISAHLGNWEVLEMFFSRLGYPIAAIYNRLFDDSIDRLICKWRSFFGAKLFEKKDSLRKVMRFLDNNGLVYILFDQKSTSPGSIKTQFFGRDTTTSIVPLNLAARIKAPLIPVFLIRKEKINSIVVYKPIIIKNAKKNSLIINETLKSLNKILEQLILEYPEQWLWSYDKWSTLDKTRSRD